MTASDNTVKKVATVVRKYVPKEKLEALCNDLSVIGGNYSFVQTIKLLVKELKKATPLPKEDNDLNAMDGSLMR